MAVALADLQHSGNYHRRRSLRKVLLSFGAIISATFYRNRVNTPNWSTPPYVSRSRSRRKRTEVRRAKELHLDWGKQDKVVINTALDTAAVKLRAQEWCFPAGAASKPPRSPWELEYEVSHQRSSLSVSRTTKLNRWSASEYSWYPHYSTPLLHHRPSVPHHEQAQIDPNVRHCMLYTRHDKQSV